MTVAKTAVLLAALAAAAAPARAQPSPPPAQESGRPQSPAAAQTPQPAPAQTPAHGPAEARDQPPAQIGTAGEASPSRQPAPDFGAYLAAQFASEQGNERQAALRMETALRADPEDGQLRTDAFVLALLARTADLPELARNVPQNPMAQLVLATIAARAGNWQSAELQFAELPHDDLMDTMRPLLTAWSQEAQGYADRALDTLQPAIKDGKLGGICLLHGAMIADAAHRDGLAKRLYSDLAHAQATPSLQFAQLYASFQAREGDADAAKATIENVLRQAPELEIARPGLLAALDKPQAPDAAEGLARAYVEVAATLRAQKHDDVAALIDSLALLLKPGLTDAHLLAADLDTDQKHFRAASDALEGTPATDPLMPVIEMRKAALYQRQDRSGEALAVLQALAQRFPSRPEPLAALGDAYSDSKQYDKAVDAYDGAIALLRHPTSADWVVFYARGAALERTGHWTRAEADMNRALELSPDQPYVLNFLGYALAERKQDLPLAQDMVQKALKARPNDGAIMDSLGWVKLQEGDVQEALRLLERAAELDPEDPSITGHLGDAYWDAGRHIEAEDQWRRALVLKPEPDDAARIEARLKTIGK